MAKNRSTSGLLRRLKKAHKKQNTSEFDYVFALLEERINNLQKMVEIGPNKAKKKEDRSLELLSVTGNINSLTVNPVTGRFTLKVSVKSSPQVAADLKTFVQKIMEQDFEPISIRGSIKWYKDCYQCYLQSHNKKTAKIFWFKDGELYV